MKQTYTLSGITCMGCVNQVKIALLKAEDVSEVFIDLKSKQVTIVTSKHIALSVFKDLLPDKYAILDAENTNVFTPNTKNISAEQGMPISKLKQLKPLLLIFIYLLFASVLLHKDDWDVTKMMLDFMGLFYIVFSFFKFLDIKGFVGSFKMYDPLAKTITFYAVLYPFIETVLGIMFLLRFKIVVALIATLIILGITTVGVARALVNKKKIPCACLGTALKLPMTEATLIENGIMILMAVFMLLNTF